MGASLSTGATSRPPLSSQYGLWSSPNMQDIHDQNLAFFSPNPYFIGAFFFPQQLFQLAWLYKLFRLDERTPAQAEDLEQIRRYVPCYALGNICIGTWMFFWNSSRLDLSNVFVIINTLSQLWYAQTQLEPMDTRHWNSILTHVVSKTFAGIGVLDLLHNTSAAYFVGQAPSMLVKALTGVGFTALGASSDWILGGCLVYDLVGLSVGQAQCGEKGWSSLLGAYAVGTAAIVGGMNYFLK
ncbi:hypothetical protein LTR53_000028 [Teratosphaeriaceae sp. CCFEE 6253]|nr:hypothetical protein LTR53_000028 [Teratosphaeriaceae sp. CCFEE 6253]